MAEGRESGHTGGDRLTRGQMAKLNQISKKTLLVYEEKGVLVPDRVDEETGYRYYSYEQCSLLDIIQQLQNAGASLTEIKEILDSRDLDRTSELLESRLDDLAQRAREIEIARRTASDLLATCRLLRDDRPACDVVGLEWAPRRRIVFLPVEPYRFEPRQTDENPRLRKWEKALRQIKRDFPRYGLPRALFHNIGCIIDRDSLASREFICPGGYIDNEEGFGTAEPAYWEAGYNLTVTIDTVFLPDGRHAEYYWLERLLDIAEENGFAVRDHYHCDILAETPAFFYAGRDMMMRLFLPVDIGAAVPPFAGVAFIADEQPSCTTV